jgi:hypothetical protein
LPARARGVAARAALPAFCAKLVDDVSTDPARVPELVVEAGPLAGRSYSFSDRVVLGRGELVDLKLDDVTVSRRHCEIRPIDGGWEIRDLDSANGTLLNDVRLAEPAALADDDRIGMGQLVLRVSLAARADATPLPTTPLPAEGAGNRVFQDLLSRLRMFCDLGELGGLRFSIDELSRRALGALLQGFPRLNRAALFVHVPVGDTLSLLAQLTRDGRGLQPTSIAPLAREAMGHDGGMLLIDEAERRQLTERLRMPPLYGACAVLPLCGNGETFGVLYADSEKDAAALRAADREHLLAAAGLIGCLLVPLREPPRDFEVERHDLTLARRIQQRFLPQAPPTLTGYTVVDSYSAARVIGGDHYDFVTLVDGRQALIVADVSGKALSGALYMARLGAVLKQAASRARNACELLDDVNRVLYAELEAGMFVTMLVLVLEPRSGIAEVASAGHPLPLVRHRDSRVDTLAAPSGAALGAMSDPGYQAARLTLAPGDLVLMYTDGLDQAHDAEQQRFGLERVRAQLERADGAATLVRQLREELARFVGSEPQTDDLTLVVLQRLPD